MRIEIPFKNPKTNEIKRVKLGFSWILLFWSGLLGLPLFLRKLYVWGGIMLVLWVVNLAVQNSADPSLSVVLFVVALIVQLFLGIKGNEITAKNYLENGWQFQEPDGDFTKMAKTRWGLAS